MKYTLKTLMVAITIFCILLGLWTVYPRDRFHYQQKVNITGGFYQGQVGTIVADKSFWRYSVILGDRYVYTSSHQTISQFHLEPMLGKIDVK